jgi:dephospho-CoA kinase
VAFLIGVTGNIACGKSTVIKLMRELGAETIDADKVAHRQMKPETPVWREVIREFGAEIVKPNGEIDRGVLGAKVFKNPEALARLEQITYPTLLAEVRGIIARSQAEVVVLEAVKLYESGMYRMCDSVWSIVCGRDQQLHRLMAERGLTKAESEARFEAQESLQENVERANVVIDNSGSLENTRAQVVAALEKITGHPATLHKS